MCGALKNLRVGDDVGITIYQHTPVIRVIVRERRGD